VKLNLRNAEDRLAPVEELEVTTWKQAALAVEEAGHKKPRRIGKAAIEAGRGVSFVPRVQTKSAVVLAEHASLVAKELVTASRYKAGDYLEERAVLDNGRDVLVTCTWETGHYALDMLTVPVAWASTHGYVMSRDQELADQLVRLETGGNRLVPIHI